MINGELADAIVPKEPRIPFPIAFALVGYN
jgi:hypothetical protein